MDEHQRSAVDDGRDFADKAIPTACYAPFGSLYLDPRGNVLACCHNTDHRLGNIAESTLEAIWRGERAEALRRSLMDYDLSTGCRFCAWQVDEGNYGATYALSFEHLAVEDESPAWPKRLEFAVSNTCNLECVMCNGDWSSRIRSRREGRPPLPKAYDDRFFHDLRPFLHHLEEARFLGGEPLLAEETLRIMDLMVEEGLQIPCHLTTNGTQWNPRVERILEALPVSVAVSLDGVTAATVEAIRVGASHETLMENLARFRSYTVARGTGLDLTFCFMAQNWHEFGDYLQLADDWGCGVYVNTVLDTAYSPFQLSPTDFDEMLAALESDDSRRRGELDLNRDVWITELDRLRSWRARRAAAPSTPVDGPRRSSGGVYFEPTPVPEALRSETATTTRPTPRAATVMARAGMPDAALSILRADERDIVVSVDGEEGGPHRSSFIGVPAAECVGRPFIDLVRSLARKHGEQVRTVRDDLVDGAAVRQVVYHRADGAATYVQVVSCPDGPGDQPVGSFMVAAWTHQPPDWAGVTVD